MPNRLANEDSLYLRQHQDNPVDWYPWGDEAFEKARKEDKPVLVSIGYSSCHWCHVMAHESFENDYIARLMNTHFVCIKVDREERPEIDQIYMDAVQMLNGQGGWPLNVFCLSDGRPFAGGTYFPPDERRGHNIVPWPQLLMRIADFYSRQRDDLEKNAQAILGNLKASNAPPEAKGTRLGPDEFINSARQLLDNHDPVFGGFGGAPKFPPSMSLDFLLAIRGSATVEQNHPRLAGQIDTVINRTLTGMGHGGLFDQIGGGFSRYSVDQQWLIPHFEKMLYDNALLIDIYAKATSRFDKPLYRRIVEETIEWLSREMVSPEGAYFSAIDADTDGEEGTTYLWDPEEVLSHLGTAEGERFCHTYGITSQGNFENSGKSNPSLLEGDPSIRDSFAEARGILLGVRNKRPQPACDNKRLTAWNALLARALARAAFSFGRPDWLEKALSIGEWIWTSMRRDENELFAVSYGKEGREKGKLDDYAYTAEAFLAISAVVDWQHPGDSGIWLERARLLAAAVRERFADPSGPGFFMTGDDHEVLIHRKKDWFDNAIPSGNSSMVHVFSVLEALTGEGHFGEETSRLKSLYPGIMAAAPGAASHALTGLIYQAIGIATVKYRKGADLESLRQALVTRPWRPIYILEDASLLQSADFQLCVGTHCLAPTDSAMEVAESL